MRRRIDALDRRIVAAAERAGRARPRRSGGRRRRRAAGGPRRRAEREVLLRVSMANDGPDPPGGPPRDLPPPIARRGRSRRATGRGPDWTAATRVRRIRSMGRSIEASARTTARNHIGVLPGSSHSDPSADCDSRCRWRSLEASHPGRTWHSSTRPSRPVDRGSRGRRRPEPDRRFPSAVPGPGSGLDRVRRDATLPNASVQIVTGKVSGTAGSNSEASQARSSTTDQPRRTACLRHEEDDRLRPALDTGPKLAQCGSA